MVLDANDLYETSRCDPLLLSGVVLVQCPRLSRYMLDHNGCTALIQRGNPCCNMQWSPTCQHSSATARIVVGEENG